MSPGSYQQNTSSTVHILLKIQKAHRGDLGGGKAISGSHPSACNFLDQDERKSPRNDSRTGITCPEGYLHTADRTACFASEEDWGEEDDLPTYGQTEKRKLSTIVSVSATMLKKILSDYEDGAVLVVQNVLFADKVEPAFDYSVKD